MNRRSRPVSGERGAPEGQIHPEPRHSGLRQWIREHDESWIFVALYLGLAVGLSVFVSLFWLVVVAALHFVLEIIRQRYFRRRHRSVFLHALWEVKLDVGLVLLALTLVLYIDIILGVLGLQSAARAAAVSRAGARIGTRAAAWERNLRTFLLTVDEMARVAHAGIMLRRRGRGNRAATVASGSTTAAVAESGGPATVEVSPAPAEGGGTAAMEASPVVVATEPDPEPRPESPGETAGSSGHAWQGRWGIGDRIGVALVMVGVALLLAAPFLTVHDWTTAGEALLHELRPFPGRE